MMGRLKTIYSHCRNMDMTATEKTIKYTIPLYSEKDTLGMFRGIEVLDNEIRLMFDVVKNEEKPIKESPLKIDKTPTVVGFS